jgi:hypothetical protein
MTKLRDSIKFEEPFLAKTNVERGCDVMAEYKELNGIIEKISKFASEGKAV